MHKRRVRVFRFIRSFLLFFVFVVAILAFQQLEAAVGEGGDHHGLPKSLPYQVLNFGILVGLLYFLLRKRVVDFFASQLVQFHRERAQAETAMRQAEEALQDVKARLRSLSETREEVLNRTKQEASEMKERMLGETHQQIQRMLDQAQKEANIEILKAKEQVKQKVVAQVFSQVLGQFKERGLDKTAHLGLQKEVLGYLS